MIDYMCQKTEGCRPRILKRFTASSGEQFTAEVLVLQEDEREHLTTEQVYEHIDNLVLYIQEVSQRVEPVRADEQIGDNPWPLRGWEEVEWAKDQALRWWEYIYFRDEHEHEHEHEHDGADHD